MWFIVGPQGVMMKNSTSHPHSICLRCKHGATIRVNLTKTRPKSSINGSLPIIITQIYMLAVIRVGKMNPWEFAADI